MHVEKAMAVLELYMNVDYSKGCDVMRDRAKFLLVEKTWTKRGSWQGRISFGKKHVEVRGVRDPE